MNPRRIAAAAMIAWLVSRFGLLLGVVVVSFAVIWNYVTQPISAIVGVAEVFEYMVGAMISGAIIGAIYRPNRPSMAGET